MLATPSPETLPSATPPASGLLASGLLGPDQPVGALRLPAQLITSLRLTPQQFAQLCEANPEAVLELTAYQRNGARLGWRLIPSERTVEVWEPLETGEQGRLRCSRAGLAAGSACRSAGLSAAARWLLHPYSLPGRHTRVALRCDRLVYSLAEWRSQSCWRTAAGAS